MSGKELEVVKPRQEIQVIDLDGVKQMMAAFSRFKREVLEPGDYWVDRKDKTKLHVRKPGWEKYATALHVSSDYSEERSEVIKFKGQEILVFHFKGRAIANDGRYTERSGSASSDEGKPWAETVHGIRSMAQTRAVLRAISALVGGGELTAEEIDTKSFDAEYTLRDSPKTPSAVHDQHDEDAAISLEQDIIDTLQAAGLDPNGIEITKGRDWGQLIIKPNWPKPKDGEESPWRKYADALAPFQVKYHGAKEKDTCALEHLYNWTIGVA